MIYRIRVDGSLCHFVILSLSQRRNEMKQHNLAVEGSLLYAILAFLLWWVLPTNGLIVIVGVFGFFSLIVLSPKMDEMMTRYDSLVIPGVFFHPVFVVGFLFFRVTVFFGAMFVFALQKHYDIVLSMQTPFLVFSATVIYFSVLEYVAGSKLTPKPGTMVVDNDLYYLPSEMLPRLSAGARVITEKTVIPVSASVTGEDGAITLSGSFRFAPWVFVPENRHRLPGHLYYSVLFRKAEREFAAMLQNRNQTGDTEASPYIFQYVEK